MEIIALGIIVFFIGFFCRRSDHNFFKTAIKVEGKITAYRPKDIYNTERREYERVYYPIISFQFDGEEREITDNNYSYYKPPLGFRRQLGINPQDSNDVRVYSGESELLDWFFMFLGIACLFCGGAVTLIGLLILVF